MIISIVILIYEALLTSSKHKYNNKRQLYTAFNLPPKWYMFKGWMSWCISISDVIRWRINTAVEFKQILIALSENHCTVKYCVLSAKSVSKYLLASTSFPIFMYFRYLASNALIPARQCPGMSISGMTWIFRSLAYLNISI